MVLSIRSSKGAVVAAIAWCLASDDEISCSDGILPSPRQFDNGASAGEMSPDDGRMPSLQNAKPRARITSGMVSNVARGQIPGNTDSPSRLGFPHEALMLLFAAGLPVLLSAAATRWRRLRGAGQC